MSSTLLRRLPDQQVPIVIRTQGTASLAGFLSSDDEGRSTFQHVHTFSLLDRTCTLDLLSSGPHEYLARALHEEYVSQQTKAGSAEGPASLSWAQLPEPIKEANRKQVDRIGANLEAVGCRIAPLMDWDSPHLHLRMQKSRSLPVVSIKDGAMICVGVDGASPRGRRIRKRRPIPIS